MQYWHFSETAYPYLPPEETMNSIRVTLPNCVIDPERAKGLWDRYLAEWQVADECGLNVMINEHHATATCMDPAAPIVAGILGRITENARILILGNPVANRKDPVRIAEEMALVDLLSHRVAPPGIQILATWRGQCGAHLQPVGLQPVQRAQHTVKA